jgi:hypothetical protein
LISVLDRGSVGNYQASCHNQFNPSVVVHLDGQPPTYIQEGLTAGRLVAERGGRSRLAPPPRLNPPMTTLSNDLLHDLGVV